MSNPIPINGSGVSNLVKTAHGVAAPTSDKSTKSFADMLEGSLTEVSRLQKDASEAVQKLVTGQTDDIAGVMSAMEKSSIAFKTLLTIRGKLMEAYEQIRNIPI